MKDESKKHRESFDHAWSKMIAHAWRDPKFKERLLKEPLKVFEEHGIELPSGIECKVHENTKKGIHFFKARSIVLEIVVTAAKLLVSLWQKHPSCPDKPRRVRRGKILHITIG